MWMDVPLRSINKERIESLLRDAVREGRLLDYKETQPAPKQKPDNTDFLVDVSAMANGAGGLLVYGVAEARDENNLTTGTPAKIDGLKGFTLDAEETRLRRYIASGLDPALPPDGIEFHGVDGFADGPVVLLRVRRSWRGPHMVTSDGRYRDTFHTRDGNMNRKLDAQGIREAMLAMENVSERIDALVGGRIGLLENNATPVVLRPGARLAVHVVPLASLRRTSAIEPREARRLWNGSKAVPLFSTPAHCDDRYNVDGLLIAAKRLENKMSGSYLLVFRSGYLEAVDSSRITSPLKEEAGDMPSALVERELFERVPAYMKYLRDLGCEPPYSVHVSLLGVKGYCHHGIKSRSAIEDGTVPYFDRKIVRLPPLLIEADQLDQKPPPLLEPLIHNFWQAGGVEACPHYRYGEYDVKHAGVW